MSAADEEVTRTVDVARNAVPSSTGGPSVRVHASAADETEVLTASSEDSAAAAAEPVPDEPEEAEEPFAERVAGRIISIYLENYTPGPAINFLCGPNGSGKSSVLVALAICLGARASSTQRAPNVSALVNHHGSTARVELTLNNDGPDAYLPEHYGKRLIIERILRKSGASSVLLKGENGKVPAGFGKNRAAEVERMCDHFGIQPNNPCIIMSQDDSRELLSADSTRGPREKFLFFMRGTHLLHVEEKLAEIRNELLSMDGVIKAKTKGIGLIGDALKGLEEKLQRGEALADIRREIAEHRTALAWTSVVEAEELLSKKDEKLRKFQAKMDDFERRRTEVQEKLDEADAERAAAAREERNYTSTLTALASEVRTNNDCVDRASAVVSRHKANLLSAKSQAESCERALANAQAELAQSNGDTAVATEDLDDVIKRRQSDTAAKKAELDAAKERVVAANERFDAAQERVRQAEQEHAEAQTRAAAAEREKENKATFLQRLRRNATTANREFHSDEKRIAAVIDRIAPRCSERPLGPLGAYLSVSVPQFGRAVETSLGALLSTYVVASFDDLGIFRRALDEARIRRRNVSIVVQNFKAPPYRTPVLRGMHTVLSVLSFRHPVIRNVCIDQRRIECRIIMKDKGEIMSRMASLRQDGEFRYQGEKVTIHACDGFVAESYSGTEAVEKRVTQGYFDSDLRAQITEADTEVKEAERALSQHNRALAAAGKAVDHARNDAADAEKAVAAADKAVSQLQRELARLESEQEEAEAEFAATQASQRETSYDTLTVNVRKAEEALKRARREIEKLESQLEAATENHAAATKKAEEVRKKLEDTRSASLTGSSEFDEAVERANQLRTQLQKLDEGAESLTCDVDAAKEEKRQVEASVLQLTRSAEVVGARPDRIPDRAECERLLDAAKERMHTQEEQLALQCSIEELERQVQDKRQIYELRSQQLRNEKEKWNSMRNAQKRRKASYKHRRVNESKQVDMKFSMILKQLHMGGNVIVDYDERTLGILVNNGQAGMEAVQQQTSSLSGGERSIATTSLLQAIGYRLDCPFCLVDEFDVFMDAARRRTVMQQMVSALRQRRGRQYIFVSPLAKEDIPQGDDVNVVELRAPRRPGAGGDA